MSYPLGLSLAFLGILHCPVSLTAPQPLSYLCVPDLVWNFTAVDTWLFPSDVESENVYQECSSKNKLELVKSYNISFRLKLSTCNVQKETDWAEMLVPSYLGTLAPPSDLKRSVKNICVFNWTWNPVAGNGLCGVKYYSSFKSGSEDWKNLHLSFHRSREEQLNQNNDIAFRVKAAQSCYFHQESEWVELNLQPSDVFPPDCSINVSLEQKCTPDWKEQLGSSTTCKFSFIMQSKMSDAEEWKDFNQQTQKLQSLIYKNGMSFRVKAILNCIVKLESDWTENTFSSVGEPSFKNVECIKYSEGYMNCTWEADKTLSSDKTYGLQYWHSELDDIRQCSHPIIVGGVVSGCHLDEDEMDPVDEMCLEVFGKDKNVIRAFRILQIVDIEKPSTPKVSIHWNETQGKITLTWSKPSNMTEYWEDRLEYQVEFKDSKSNKWETVDDLQPTSGFSMSSVDRKLKYTFRVRARYNIYRRDKTALWSDWSQEVEYGEDTQKSRNVYIVILIVIPAIVAVLAIILLVYLKRLKILILPPVPDPRKYFMYMLEQGGEKTWIKSHKDNPVFTPPVEETPDILTVEELPFFPEEQKKDE